MSPRTIARATRALRAIAAASIATVIALSSPCGALAASKTPAPKRSTSSTTPSASSAPSTSRPPGKPDAKTPSARGPLSIGAPNRGQLRDGMRLRGTKHLRQREGARSWGLPSLVRMLRRAAAEVAKKHRGSVLIVGDLSARRGGSIEGHASHQSGRDADVGFFVANSKGKPVAVKRFVPFDGSGNGRDREWARFDDARNWALVEALLKDEEAVVRYIFVSSGLRSRLLAYAAKKRAPKEIIARAAAVMSPRDADLHDDHFHIRIACPASMQPTCAEEPTARDSASAPTPHNDAGSSAKQAGAPSPPAPAPAPAETNGKAASAVTVNAGGEKAKADKAPNSQTGAETHEKARASETPSAPPPPPAQSGIGSTSAPSP